MRKILILSIMFLFVATFAFSGSYKTIKVQKGDTIQKIAKKHLKNKDNWQALLKYNKLNSPKSVKPGMKLKIPYSLSKERVAKITFVKGSVTVNGKSASLGKLVKKGDKIKTGSNGKATIKLDDGSNIKVEKNSEVVLTDYGFKNRGRSSNVKLNNGGMMVKVNKLTQKSNFSVSSVTAVAGVRGTTFHVTNDNLTVYAGEVKVKDKNDKEISVTKGEAVKIDKTSQSVTKTANVPKKLNWIK